MRKSIHFTFLSLLLVSSAFALPGKGGGTGCQRETQHTVTTVSGPIVELPLECGSDEVAELAQSGAIEAIASA